MLLRALGSAVGDADSALAVAMRACTAISGCTVTYLDEHGTPLVIVDSVTERSDCERAAYLDRGWRTDAMLRNVIEHRCVTEGSSGQLVPLLHPAGLLGTIGTIRASLHTVSAAIVIAARLGYLGVRPWRASVDARLTPRQREIAELAAAGATTEEIALQLAISRNTVKACLKHVFERLDVTRRVELVAALQRERARLDVVPGITHVDAVTITAREYVVAPRARATSAL